MTIAVGRVIQLVNIKVPSKVPFQSAAAFFLKTEKKKKILKKGIPAKLPSAIPPSTW